MKDLKAALGSNIKPDITHVRTQFAVYTARPCEYGNVKYQRANYLRYTDGTPHTTPTAEDFERLRAYLRANLSHVMQALDAMEIHQSNDPLLQDVAGMKRAAYAVDTDVTPGAKVGASFLPHIAPACASLQMAICQAVMCGLLPADPGPTWETGVPEGWREPVVNGDKMPFDGEYGLVLGRPESWASGQYIGVAATAIAKGEPVVGTVAKFKDCGDGHYTAEIELKTFQGRENDDWAAPLGWTPGPV